MHAQGDEPVTGAPGADDQRERKFAGVQQKDATGLLQVCNLRSIQYFHFHLYSPAVVGSRILYAAGTRKPLVAGNEGICSSQLTGTCSSRLSHLFGRDRIRGTYSQVFSDTNPVTAGRVQMIGGSDQHTVPQGEGFAGEGFAAVEGGGKVA